MNKQLQSPLQEFRSSPPHRQWRITFSISALLCLIAGAVYLFVSPVQRPPDPSNLNVIDAVVTGPPSSVYRQTDLVEIPLTLSTKSGDRKVQIEVMRNSPSIKSLSQSERFKAHVQQVDSSFKVWALLNRDQIVYSEADAIHVLAYRRSNDLGYVWLLLGAAGVFFLVGAVVWAKAARRTQ